MNFRFQTRSTTTESFDSVSSVAGRPTHGRPMAAVRRRRPRLSAPTPSLGRHDATPSLDRPHFASPALPLSSISPRRAPPRTSSLARASLAVSGQASQPNPSPKLPLPRRHLLGHCRAWVRRHCRAPSRSSSPEFRPSSHRRRSQASLLHHFTPFLFLSLSLGSLMLGVNLNRDGIGCARRRTARSAAEPPFTPASPLELGRVRVLHLGKSALVRVSRWCPWFPQRPRRR